MPTPGRRTPRNYKSAEYYFNRIPIFHPDQERLKNQLLEIFGHGEENTVLLQRVRAELNDGLLVSKEVVSNPKVYQYLREALESRNVRVPATVIDTESGSFVAKRIIAAIWVESEDKVKRDSLLLEYHNVRQLIVNSKKDILSEQQDESTRLETNPGASSSSRRSPQEINDARQTLDRMETEEQRAITGRDLGNESPGDEVAEQELEHNEGEHEAPGPHMQLRTSDQQEDNDNDEEQEQLPVETGNPTRAADDDRSIELITPRGFNPLDDRNVTRRPRQPRERHMHTTAGRDSQTAATSVPRIPQDIRRAAASADLNDDKMKELILLMAGVLERITKSPTSNEQSQSNQQSPGSSANNNSWNDPKDIRRRARKSIATQFAKKLFSGKFGDNWDRHQERFVKVCNEWEVPAGEYVDFLQETLSGDALNYVEAKMEDNPSITWNYLSKLLHERYNNINRQKEISDRLLSMRYEDFHTKGDSPATTLDRITAYIDKLAVLALPVDRTDDAKARFVSNVTRGQVWAYHAKGRISPTATYDRIVQAFATSIRDRSELESGRFTSGSHSRRGTYNRKELYKTGKSQRDSDTNGGNSDDEIFMNNSSDEVYDSTKEDFSRDELYSALETFFGSARYANRPSSVKPNGYNNTSNRRFGSTANRYTPNWTNPRINFQPSSNTNNSASSVGCFNCGKQGCSVATCPVKRDPGRIAGNISRWKELRKINRSVKININTVPQACTSQDEAKEVMIAAILVNQYQDQNTEETLNSESLNDPLVHLNETLQTNALNHLCSAQSDETNEDDESDAFEIQLLTTTPRASDEIVCKNTYTINRSSLPVPNTKRYGKDEFIGACLDTGAQRSVCGWNQAVAYNRLHPGSLSKKASAVRFKFGEQIAHSIGTISIKFPIDRYNHLDFSIEIVNVDIPLIIGLDILKSRKLLVNYVDSTLVYCNEKTSRPITFKLGHVFVEWSHSEILFTKEELNRLHLHFMHPSGSRLFQLISRADPTKNNPSVKKLIEEVTNACNTCKSFKSSPLHFKATIPSDQLIFNHTICIDLVWLYEKPVLHVIDEQTGFRNACFLKSKNASDIWNAFLGCWVSIYVGFPRKIRTDQESAATSDDFLQIAASHGIMLEFSGVASHNSMGQIESSHGPLRRIYRILTEEHPSLSDNLRLRLTVKALNDTAGAKGLVPSLLVFGVIPSLGNTEADLPTQGERFRAMHEARHEAATIIAEKRIRTALRANIPPSAKYKLKEGQKVLAYNEKQKRWIPNLRIVRISDKHAWINDGSKVYKANVAQIIPHSNDQDSTQMSKLLKKLAPLSSKPLPHILLTEVLTPGDTRSNLKEFDLAKAKEITSLLDKGAFRVVMRQDLDDNANVLGGRFVLTIKHKGTGEELFKARFVVQGHLDREKEFLVHASTTVSQQTIKLLISLATILGYRLWSEDMTLAYIQGASKILRKVYLRGSPEFQLTSEQLLEILRPLYGLSDSGDYWHGTFVKHFRKDLTMQTSASDLSLFFKIIQSKLQGLTATHVDDTLSAGDEQFEKETQLTGKIFDAKPRKYDDLTFAGVTIETRSDGSRLMHQAEYAQKIQTLGKGCTFEEFRSKRHELAWLTHTRPDVAAEAAILAQVTAQLFKPLHITQLNATITRVNSEPHLGLIVHKLEKESLNIVVHADASFANLHDLRTQLGFVILLTDHTKRVNWLQYRSYKCKRIVRSVLGGETHAFVDAFDNAYAIRHDMENMLQQKIPLNIVTDSDSLFKVIVQSSNTTEKRLMIDLQATREAYHEHKIDNMGWIKSCGNLADGLTKINKSDLIQKTMRTGTLNVAAD